LSVFGSDLWLLLTYHFPSLRRFRAVYPDCLFLVPTGGHKNHQDFCGNLAAFRLLVLDTPVDEKLIF
jgi:hypothetical protein